MRRAGRWACAALALVVVSTTPADAQSASVSIRPFVLVASEQFAAKTTFDAVFGTTRGTFIGGGGQLVAGRYFLEISASQFKKTGQRAFLFQGQAFRLGIPLTITVRPVEVSGGYRVPLRHAPWLVPYAGAGIGWYRYKETSDFSEPGDDVDVTHTGYLAVGGVELRLLRWMGVSAEAAYTHVAGILGEAGISKDAGESDLGGTAIRLRVIVGR